MAQVWAEPAASDRNSTGALGASLASARLGVGPALNARPAAVNATATATAILLDQILLLTCLDHPHGDDDGDGWTVGSDHYLGLTWLAEPRVRGG